MSQLWTIVAQSDGAVLAVGFPTPTAGSHPKDNGWAWDAATQRAVRIDAAPDLATQSWNGSAWVEDLAKLEQLLLRDLFDASERQRMLVTPRGFGAGREMEAMRREVNDFRGLASSLAGQISAVLGLSTPARTRRFRFAERSAARHGEPSIAAAITRFEAVLDPLEDKLADIRAAWELATEAIRAAPTAAAKRSAAAAVTWPN